MKILRIISIVLALLFLAACAGPVGPGYPEEPTTTEATTEPAELGTGTEIELNENITVFEVLRSWGFPYEIWMRNEQTGEEEFLLGAHPTHYLLPVLGEQINERFFWYVYVLPETCGRSGVYFYDIEQRRSIELLSPREAAMSFVRAEQGRVYLIECRGLGPWDEEISVYYFEISALESGEAIAPQPAGMTIGELEA